MKNIDMKRLFNGRDTGNIIIFTASIVLIYIIVSIYFANHFFFGTVINGVNVSLKAHDEAEGIIKSYIKSYKLQLIERNGETEGISGHDIGLRYNEKNSIPRIYHAQNSFKWINPLFKSQKYYLNDLFAYDRDSLESKINELSCLNEAVIEPQNVKFRYSDGSYEVLPEVYGNKIIRDKLNEAIKMSILNGETKLDLNERHCYENPKYTINSDKTPETLNLLNKYISAKITYIFGSESELLDGNEINKWLSVDENLEVIIDKQAVWEYVQGLSKRFDTVGIARKFKTSVGKVVEVKGGLYGWKINRAAETSALIQNIKLGAAVEKEPVYTQKALLRGENEIGDTYVEINITGQRLWFYKNGRLIAGGAIVSGDPGRGYSTVLGTYMLNYKQMGTTLIGPDYEAEVTYWMPFFGNIGIHDASWRYSFGGDIYKGNGTHGCVNVPKYLAKRIYENIEPGTPIICYEE